MRLVSKDSACFALQIYGQVLSVRPQRDSSGERRRPNLRKFNSVRERERKRESFLLLAVAGMLRTAVGKATLLVSDKFAQFRGLCEENLAASGATPYATRSSDLEGFWAMVELQVGDVRGLFADVRQLAANAWRLPERAPPPNARRRRQAPPSAAKRVQRPSLRTRDSASL